MVYIMNMYVDGGCRGNGRPGAFGVAAAVNKLKWGRQKWWTEKLPGQMVPTNQRAEIFAIILGLRNALERHRNLIMNPRLRLTIYSDSKYAIGCMTEWVHKWTQNGWRNAAGSPVANQDLIRHALWLEDQVKRKGSIKYVYIPRENNQEADRRCNELMDQIQRGEGENSNGY